MITLEQLKSYADASILSDKTLPEQTLRERFDYVTRIYLQTKGKGLGRDIAIYSKNEEHEWENRYLASRLIYSCQGTIRIYTHELQKSIYSDPILVAHLENWLDLDARNTIRVLLDTINGSKNAFFYKAMRKHLTERVQIQAAYPPLVECSVKGALFGTTGFKFSDNREEGGAPLYIGNFDAPNVVEKLSTMFDSVFDRSEARMGQTFDTKISKQSPLDVETHHIDIAQETMTSNFCSALAECIDETGARHVVIPHQFNKMISNLDALRMAYS
ncbi:MAG: hypothetical protein AB2826_24210 [Candidatus Thiodiazotropha sp.]